MNKDMKETIKYDSRHKKMIRIIEETGEGGETMGLGESKDCKYTIKNEQEYGPDSIKKIWGELKRQRDDLNKTLNSANNTLDAVKDLEDDNEIRELAEKLKKVQQLDKKYKAEAQKTHALENLQLVNKQMRDIRQAVNPHVKLE